MGRMPPLDRKTHAVDQLVHASLHTDYDFNFGKDYKKTSPYP